MILPHLITTRSELKYAVSMLGEQPAFSFDVETNGLDVFSNWVTWIGLASYGQVYLVPMGHQRGRMLTPGTEEKVLPPEENRRVLLSGKLSQAKVVRKVPPVYAPPPPQLDPAVVFKELEPLLFGDQIKVAWNARFDLMTIAKYYGGAVPTGPYEDPMIMTHICDENRRNYELKEVILDWLRITDKVRRKTYYPKLGKTIQTEPIDDVARYLAKDAYLLWLYWKETRARMEREDLLSLLKLEMDLYPTLMRTQTNGIAVDLTKLDQVEKYLAEEIEQWEERAWTITGEPFELTNTNKKRDLLFGDKPKGQGLKPLKYTPKTHTPVLDQYTMEEYAPNNDLCDCFLHHAELKKLHSTYIIGLKARAATATDGITYIHTQLTQHRTVTGRLSSTEPNLQNIPREGSGANIREMFIAPPGCLLVVCDYDQIELRVFAHFLQDPVMMGIFLEGLDIHAETAAFILGKPASKLSHEERNTAGKTINFAISYGAGLGRLMAAGIPEDVARVFMDKYYARFATIKPWRRAVLLEADRRGDRKDPKRTPPYVTTLLGRRRRLPDLYAFSDNELRTRAERQAWNHRIQGTAAEIMKIAMLRVDRAFQALPGQPFKLLLTVHDELIAVAPEDKAEECRDIMVQAMGGIMRGNRPIIDVPLVVSCGIARAWNEAK